MGCHMDGPARDQPIADQRCLVGGVVVPDEMDLESLGDIGLDLVEELAELGRPMTAVALSDHRSWPLRRRACEFWLLRRKQIDRRLLTMFL